MSALPPKADIDGACRHVRFVPKADSYTPARCALLFDNIVGGSKQRIAAARRAHVSNTKYPSLARCVPKHRPSTSLSCMPWGVRL